LEIDALRQAHRKREERLSVGELAEMAHMSIPTFHQHFKAMTATSPLQYMKSLRLTHARQMLQAGARVNFFGFPPSGKAGSGKAAANGSTAAFSIGAPAGR
jgi:AraC-like DNA-binding protein